MKILIVSLNKETTPYLTFPIGALYVAEAIERAGHMVKLFDNILEDESNDRLKQIIFEFNPEIIGLSLRNIDNTANTTSVFYLPQYKGIVDVCRERCSTVVLGGSGFSLMPKKIIKYYNLKYGIIGEGEKAILDFLEYCQNKRKIEDCQGLIYKKDSEYAINPAKMIDDLEEIPFPDLTHLEIDKYKQEGLMKAPCNILSKRGCNLNCVYCTYPVKEGRVHRCHAPTKVVDHIEYLNKEWKITDFSFVDNVFNNPIHHAVEICEEIIRRKLEIKWTGLIVPQYLDRKFAYLIKKSGCQIAELGTDALSSRMIRSLNKQFDIETVDNSVKLLKKERLPIFTFLMFGGIGEDASTIREALDNLARYEVNFAILKFGIRVYKATRLYKMLLKKGQLFEDKELLNPYFFIDNQAKDTGLEIIHSYVSQHRNWMLQ